MNPNQVREIADYLSYLGNPTPKNPGTKRKFDKAKAVTRRKIAKRSRSVNHRIG